MQRDVCVIIKKGGHFSPLFAGFSLLASKTAETFGNGNGEPSASDSESAICSYTLLSQDISNSLNFQFFVLLFELREQWWRKQILLG